MSHSLIYGLCSVILFPMAARVEQKVGIIHSTNGCRPETTDAFDGSLARLPNENDSSPVRNSEYRKYESILDPLVPLIYNASRGVVKAKNISWAALGANILATELAEYQNRTGRYTISRTALSMFLRFVGEIGDGIDGKYARHERSFMTNKEEIKKHKKDGNALDPFLDGLGEAHKKLAGGITAWWLGDFDSARAALRGLRKTNLPRTAKAAVGALGVAVPESYKPWDFRCYGTSLGRKFPDFVSTYVHKFRGIPVQRHLDNFTAEANDTVTLQRLASFKNPKTLGDEEIDHARNRLKVLGKESLVFYTVGHLLEWLLLTDRTEVCSSTS